MTIESDLATLIDELETNLQAMGVSDAEFDATTGIRGLVARIIDINPSLTGVNLTTNVSCSASHQTIVMGNTLTITGVLTATYDDTNVTNVDLSGYLQGATINIYNGQTLLGTAITDANGVYTFSYITNTITNLSILAQFDGTDDYSSCASNNVAVSVTGEITLTGNKRILSAADHETLSLTAYLTDTIIENVDINFYKEGNNMTKTLIGTATTDANGVATITYESTGAGDVNIIAECESSSGTLVSKTYAICDAWKHISNGSVTNSGTSLLFTNVFDANGIGDCEITCKLKSATTKAFSIDYKAINSNDNVSHIRVGVMGDNTKKASYINSNGQANNYPSDSQWGTYSANTEIPISIRYENNTLVITLDSNTYTYTNVTESFRYVGFSVWQDAKTITYSDLIVKPL